MRNIHRNIEMVKHQIKFAEQAVERAKRERNLCLNAFELSRNDCDLSHARVDLRHWEKQLSILESKLNFN